MSGPDATSAAGPAHPDGDAAPVSFLHGRLSSAFTRRVVTLEPGGSRPYRSADWADALVVVEGGELVLECTEGGRRRFPAGAVLVLAGLRLLALHNEGPGPAVLVAVSRRSPPDPPGPAAVTPQPG
ncbi:MAG TPA: hypothetical protein VEZ42_21545 [Pseudonocardia sp.]|nr:hypothetical protein [Pseudonocardia sp.]